VAREIEDVLEPGERLVWEGRPTGLPAGLSTLGCGFVAVEGVAVVLSLGSGMFIEDVFFRSRGMRVRVTDWMVAAIALLPGFAFFAIASLIALSRHRARRYGISDRRVIALDHKGRIDRVVARRPSLDASIQGHDVVIRAGADWVRFYGIADPEAALSALELTRPGR
jgi:hypothetical protein